MTEILPNVLELKEDDRDFPLRDLVPEGTPLEIEIGCGSGRFIAADAPEKLRAARQALLADIAEATRKLAQAQIPLSDILDAVKRAYNEAPQGGTP